MNHRERMIAALNHVEPDRVPRNAGLHAELCEELRRRTGHADPAEYWDFDIANVGFRPPDSRPDLIERFGHYFEGRDEEWVLDWDIRDYPPEWGVATRPAHLYSLVMPVSPMVDFTDASELDDYPFPDYVGEWRHEHLEADVARLKAEGWFVSSFLGWIFQTGWTLRSEVKLFEDFFTNPELADALLTRITEIRVAQAVRLAQAGVDSIRMHDDIGGQNGMLISPAMWREWLKPRMQQVIDAIREVNPDIYFRYHSDGDYMAVIPELIDMGISSLVTLQEESMDIYEIKRRYGDQIALEGTFGLQSTLRRGKPEEVRQEVKAQCEGMMPGGGWIASPGNGVTPDIPLENVAMMFEALDEYGVY